MCYYSIVELGSLVVAVFGSPSGVDAVAPSLVASACVAAGGLRSFVRPSSRSFSGWVCCCVFAFFDEAEWFASELSRALSIPFCRVRSYSGCFSVSVPCRVVRVRVRSRCARVGGRRFRCFGGGAAPVPPVPPAPSAPSGAAAALAPWFAAASAVGFSGSRSVAPTAAVGLAVGLVPAGVPVSVGCAAGVDECARSLLSAAGVPFSLFSVSSGRWGRGRGAFAGRSVACVRSLGAGGLWVSFPSAPCPSGLLPSASSSRCFSGSGSGSWASLAFAVGSGLSCLVFLGSVPFPLGWGLSPVPGAPGWFGVAPRPRQLSFF
ncbi:MAG: hypothetical protein AB4372_10740 [Xenococcus sp. (in: cyanobacteria)]